jgi:outer membrane protein
MELNYKIQSLQEVEKNKLVEKENSLNLELMKRIRAYLDRYCAAHGIDMVFNYMDLNQGLLYGNGAFDITKNVVEGLNTEYDEEKNNQKK